MVGFVSITNSNIDNDIQLLSITIDAIRLYNRKKHAIAFLRMLVNIKVTIQGRFQQDSTVITIYIRR